MKTHLLLAYLCLLALLLTSSSAWALNSADAQRLEAALDAFAHEPTVDDVQRHVLRRRQLRDDDIDPWTGRARFAGAIPQIQGQISWLDQRDQRNRFRENITANDAGFYEPNYAQNYMYDDLRLRAIYSLRLTFDLGKLAFSSRELAIARQVQDRHRAADDAVEEVTELYFARRQRQVEELLQRDDDLERALARRLEIESLTARIDALTGGWFSEQITEE